MPGLYGQSGNVTVNSSNTMGLYAIANTGNIVTANVSSTNTTGLYTAGGNVYVPTSAQQLLNLLSNNGTVIFQLDPAYANQRVEAFATGGGGSGNTIINLVGDVTGLGTTGNALYTTISNTAVTSGRYGAGNLIPSFVVNSQGRITAASNVALNLSSYTGNVAGNNFIVTTGIFYSNGTPFVSSSYGNSNVAAYMPGFLSTYQGNIGATRTGNITTGNIYANGGIFNGNVTVANLRVTGVTNFSNVTSSVTTTLLANANVVSTNTTTGTIISYGGVGIVGDVNIGGNLNANLGILAVGGNITTNSNVISGQGVYAPQYFWANGEVFQSSVYSNANVTAYLAAGTDPTINNIYGNLGLLTTEFTTLDANVGAFETYANATFATNANVQSLNANVGAFELYANAQINSTNANVQTLNANVGAYETWANANVSGISSNLSNVQVNLNNFEAYANLTLTSHQTEITNIVTQGNANTAAYLSTYTGNIGLSGSASQVIVPITASGTWTVPAGVTNIKLLLVGGGGGGSGTTATINYCGAGGAGGNVLYLPSVTVTSGGTYSITIGAGGAGTTANGTQGGSTSAFGYTVLGGGGGLIPSGGTPNAGGTTGIPNTGGVGSGGDYGAGGGSSSSNNGAAGTLNISVYPAQVTGGNGGNGYYFATTAQSYGGGGGGGASDYSASNYTAYGVAGTGGAGGGGNGGGSNTAYTPANGTANTGGGGGGAAAGATYRSGANGGSGVVYIVYSGLNLTYPQNIVSNTFVIGQNIVWANGTSFAATIPGNYGNANVASYLTNTYLPAYQGNIGSTRTGNVSTGNVSTGNLYSGDVNLSGNINSSLSGIGTALYINAGNIVIPQSTVTYFNGNANLNGSYLITGGGVAGIGVYPVTSYANIVLSTAGGTNPYFKGPLIGSVTATTITTGNITSTNGYFWANGLPYSGAYGNTQVAAYLPVYAGNIATNVLTVNAISSSTALYANVYNSQPQSTGLGSFSNTAILNINNSLYPAINSVAAGWTVSGPGILGVARVTSIFVSGVQTYFTIDQSVPTGTGYNSGSLSSYVFSNTVNSWLFDQSAAGNLKLPTNTSQVQYANGVSILTGIPGTYSNANVATYLASNTDPTISTLNANAAIQQTQINTNTSGLSTLNANVGAFETYANATFQTTATAYGNANVAVYLPTYSGSLDNSSSIINLYANAASQQTQINTNTSGLATLNANVGAFETYANSAFLTSSTGVTQIVAGANITISPAGGHGAVTITANTQAGTYTNSNVTNLLSGGTYTGDINAPTGVVTAAAINSTGQITANTYLQAGNGLYSLGAITEAYTDGIVVDYTTGNGRVSVGTADALTFYAGGPGTTPTAVLYPNGNLVAVGSITTTNGIFWPNGTPYSSGSTYGNTQVAAYLPTYVGLLGGNASNVTSLTGASAGTYGADTLIPVITVDSKGRITTISTVSPSGGGGSYGNANVAAYLTAPGPIGSVTPNTGAFTTLAGTLSTAAQPNITSVGTLTSLTTGNVISTNGYFWSNGTPYSTGGGGGSFTGDLAGSILYDSTNERTFANAYPLSTPDSSIPGNNYSNYYVYKPVYTNGQVQQPPLANATTGGSSIVTNSSQIVGLAQSANIALQSGYGFGSQNRTTAGAAFLTSVTPVTANTMSGNDRVRGLLGFVDLNLKGLTWGQMNSTSQNSTTIAAINGVVNIGSGGSVATAIGGAYGTFFTPPNNSTANIQYSTSVVAFQALSSANGTSAKANVVYARGISPAFSGFSANLVVQNAVMMHTYSGWAGTVGTTSGAQKAYAVLNEDATTVIQTNGNVVITGNLQTGQGYLQSYRERITSLGTAGGEQSYDLSIGTVYSITLNANLIINTTDFLNTASGSSCTIILTQDSTGGRILTSNLLYAGGSKTLSTAPNAVDVINVFYTGTQYLASLLKGYS